MDINDLARAATHSQWNRNLTWRSRLRIIIFAFPVLASLAAIGFAIEAGLYVLRSEAVDGVVVERYDWPGETVFDRNSVNYEPIFNYEMDGETLRASVGSGHSSFDIDVGERATIRAIAGERGNVRIATWQGLWFVPIVLAGIAAVSWVVALLLWAVVRRAFGPIPS